MQPSQVVILADFRAKKALAAKPPKTIYDVIDGASTSDQYREDLIEHLEIPGSYQDQLDQLIVLRDESFAIALEANSKFSLGQWTIDRINDKHVSIVLAMLGYDPSKEMTF
jgi:hypothetical protein